jgi:hypothetical protein
MWVAIIGMEAKLGVGGNGMVLVEQVLGVDQVDRRQRRRRGNLVDWVLLGSGLVG